MIYDLTVILGDFEEVGLFSWGGLQSGAARQFNPLNPALQFKMHLHLRPEQVEMDTQAAGSGLQILCCGVLQHVKHVESLDVIRYLLLVMLRDFFYCLTLYTHLITCLKYEELRSQDVKL